MLGSALAGSCSLSRPFTGRILRRTSSGNSSTSGGHSNNASGSFSADFGLVTNSSSSSPRLLRSSSSSRSGRRSGRSRKCVNLRRASLGGPRATANTEKTETAAPAPVAPAAVEAEDAKLDQEDEFEAELMGTSLPGLECLMQEDGWGSTGSPPDGAGTSRNSTCVARVPAETLGTVLCSSRTRTFNVGVVKMQGLREEMEDDTVVLDGPLGFTYAAVFDGHVGFDAVKFLREELYKECVEALQGGKLLESDDQNAVQGALINAFHQTDTRLLSWLASDSEEKEAGATGTVVFMRDDSVTVAHVGDSRAVLSQGGKAIDLSGDHRPFGNSKTALAEIRRIRTEGGWISHGRLCSTLSISRAFGDVGFKTKKKEMLENGITERHWTRTFVERLNLVGNWLSVTPDVRQIKLENDAEFIIIATDGLWDSFKSNDAVQFIRKQLKKHGDVQEAAEAIAQATLERHGEDNISVIILDFGKISREPGVKLKWW